MLTNEYFDTIGFTNKKTNRNNINTINENSIIKSNELVRDYKLLKNCHTLESIQDFIGRIGNEISFLETSSENYLNRLSVVNKRALEIAKFSSEDAKYYMYTLEALPDVKGAISNLGATVRKIFEKFLAMAAGVGKKVQTFVSNVFMKHYVNFYKNFDASKFVNLDAKIKAVKLPADAAKKIKELPSNAKYISELGYVIENGTNKDFLDKSQSEMKGMDSKEVYKQIFGSEEMPKPTEMTVGEFFQGAQKGTKPALLEILSPDMKKKWDDDLVALQESTKLIKKAIDQLKKKESEANKDDKAKMGEFKQWSSNIKLVLAKAQSNVSNSFNIKAKVAGMVYNAAKAGMGQVKENKEEK